MWCAGAERFCNGSGFYDVDVPVGHPDFSKVFRCPHNPAEADTDRKEKLRKLSNLGAFADKTFDNFIMDQHALSPNQVESLRQAHRMAIQFAERPDQKWLILQGTYGCGKTHLAAAIGNERLEQGDLVLFVTAPDLLDHLRGSYGPGAESYDQTFDRVRQADVLILDDLGVENPSEWAKEKLFQLLNYRYNERLSTVITTNTDLDMLDPRLRSRMLDIDVVRHAPITAPDYRSAQQNEREQLSDLHLYIQYRFDSFDIRTGCYPDEVQNLKLALTAAQTFTERGHGWLVLIGQSGTGKTHLAAAIANDVNRFGAEIMFVTASDLLDYLRRTFNPSSPVSFDDQFQQVKNTPFLVLDDLTTTETSKAWAREKLVQIIKHRYVKQLPTIITTTVGLEAIDSQIRTRLMDRRLCQIVGLVARPYVERTQGGL
jgi:DNA replication protein DnaC